jgi:hypothetical protein
MLPFRKGSCGHGAGANLAHFGQAAAGMAQCAHGAQGRIEQTEKQEAKIIFRQQLTARILFGGCLGCPGQMRPQTLAKLPEQFPTV